MGTAKPESREIPVTDKVLLLKTVMMSCRILYTYLFTVICLITEQTIFHRFHAAMVMNNDSRAKPSCTRENSPLVPLPWRQTFGKRDSMTERGSSTVPSHTTNKYAMHSTYRSPRHRSSHTSMNRRHAHKPALFIVQIRRLAEERRHDLKIFYRELDWFLRFLISA